MSWNIQTNASDTTVVVVGCKCGSKSTLTIVNDVKKECGSQSRGEVHCSCVHGVAQAEKSPFTLDASHQDTLLQANETK